jgi:hypothetical protein
MPATASDWSTNAVADPIPEVGVKVEVGTGIREPQGHADVGGDGNAAGPTTGREPTTKITSIVV